MHSNNDKIKGYLSQKILPPHDILFYPISYTVSSPMSDGITIYIISSCFVVDILLQVPHTNVLIFLLLDSKRSYTQRLFMLLLFRIPITIVIVLVIIIIIIDAVCVPIAVVIIIIIDLLILQIIGFHFWFSFLLLDTN